MEGFHIEKSCCFRDHVDNLGTVLYEVMYAYITVYGDRRDGSIYLAPVQMQNGTSMLVCSPEEIKKGRKANALEVSIGEGFIDFENLNEARNIRYNGTFEDLLNEKFIKLRN